MHLHFVARLRSYRQSMKKQYLLTFILSVSLLGCSKRDPQTINPEKPAPQVADQVTISPDARKRFELSTIIVQKKNAVESLSTTGEIKADENKVFHINSLTNGRVVSDYVNLGDAIRAGQKLAVVQNLDVVKIYGEFIHQQHQNLVDTKLAETKLELAQKNYTRIKTLFDEHIAPEKELIKTATDMKIEEQTVSGLKEHAHHLREEARAMLSAYGVKLPLQLPDAIESSSPIVTPRSGVITKKNVTVGDVVSNTEPLYVVADLRQVWLDVTVYDKQLMSIRQGSMVTFVSDSLPGKSFSGRVTYIKPGTEETSGTFVARVVLDNPRFDLKPGMLGQVSVRNHSTGSLPWIADTALQKYGNETFVFIDQQNGSYKKRNIVLGEPVADGYLVTSGLAVGEQIISKGSFALKAEMLKSSSEDE